MSNYFKDFNPIQCSWFLCLFIACELLKYSPIFMREKKIEINPENDKEQENRNDDIPKFNEISQQDNFWIVFLQNNRDNQDYSIDVECL